MRKSIAEETRRRDRSEDPARTARCISFVNTPGWRACQCPRTRWTPARFCCVAAGESRPTHSVSRDRSMKLTEVETQRFIDNVTSITPGALKGGLMALDRRPPSHRRVLAAAADPRRQAYALGR